MMTALYEIAHDYQALMRLDDPDIPPEAIKDTLEGLQGELEVKARNIAAYIGNIESEADMIDAAIERLAARRDSLESKAANIRAYLKANMETCNITKISSPFFTLSIKKNPAAVEIIGEVDQRFKKEKVEVTVDKKAIKAALEAGEELSFANLTQGTRLEIK